MLIKGDMLSEQASHLVLGDPSHASKLRQGYPFSGADDIAKQGRPKGIFARGFRGTSFYSTIHSCSPNLPAVQPSPHSRDPKLQTWELSAGSFDCCGNSRPTVKHTPDLDSNPKPQPEARPAQAPDPPLIDSTWPNPRSTHPGHDVWRDWILTLDFLLVTQIITRVARPTGMASKPQRATGRRP